MSRYKKPAILDLKRGEASAIRSTLFIASRWALVCRRSRMKAFASGYLIRKLTSTSVQTGTGLSFGPTTGSNCQFSTASTAFSSKP